MYQHPTDAGAEGAAQCEDVGGVPRHPSAAPARSASWRTGLIRLLCLRPRPKPRRVQNPERRLRVLDATILDHRH